MPRLMSPSPEPVVLIGAPGLTNAYARALQACGVRTEIHDGEEAACAGLFAIASQAGAV